MVGQYISREDVCLQLEKQESIDGQPRAIRRARRIVADFPAADVEPVRHAYWVKRMEERKGNGYEAFTPVWSCSDCGKDYDPTTCSIIKYCYECGAKMDGGQDDV